MIKKSFLTLMLVAIGIFAFGMAQAAVIDGLESSPTPKIPSSLNVYVNPGGLGDALIYGYYNVRGGFNYLRVVNTATSFGVGAKVRFKEGANSNEVLDFYVCLSAGDQWSAWLVGDTSTSNPASLYWYDDDTPTFPDPQGNNTVSDNQLASVALKYSATGAASSVTADRTKEGYFEIIGIGSWPDTPGSSKVVKTPNACGQTLLGTTVAVESGFTAPTLVDVPNTLAGVSFNISANDYSTYAYNATALANFRITAGAVTPGGLAVDSYPRLSDSSDGLLGVNFVLTKGVVYSIYDIETSLSGATDIIVNFPTKRLSVELDPGATPNGPFNDSATIDTTGAIADSTARCETVNLLIWDDSENTPGSTAGFSPSAPVTKKFCDEVNLVTVGATASSVVSTILQQFKIDNSGYQLGWVSIDLTGTGRTTTFTGAGTVTSATVYGLPAIGYQMQKMTSGITHMNPLRYTVSATNP